ncbi:hypothetical protein PIB30_052954 [Stylosanthes scabra]|uniref:Transposase (putative) gypsy type domain-containing protein n=1 Tax=Stylosanthes scabra TaxID=79078 RepID=A0ABU6QI62_9FABA|nr:hypothetical protein [Stylosanthes scabra]
MEDSGTEGDYVLEAAGPSDRVPFQADEGGPNFLWVYQELFTRLRVRLPFSDFQRDVMTHCQVAVSQLHPNGWGFIHAFEKVLVKAAAAATSASAASPTLVQVPPTPTASETHWAKKQSSKRERAKVVDLERASGRGGRRRPRRMMCSTGCLGMIPPGSMMWIPSRWLFRRVLTIGRPWTRV